MEKIRALIFSEQEFIRESLEKILLGRHDNIEIEIAGKCKTSLCCIDETRSKKLPSRQIPVPQMKVKSQLLPNCKSAFYRRYLLIGRKAERRLPKPW